MVKAAEPRTAAEASGRGDGGPAKAGPKRPPRPGAGVRSDAAADEARPTKPAGPKAGAAKSTEGKQAPKKASGAKADAAKPGSRAGGVKPAPKKPGSAPSNASRPPLRRRSEPLGGPLDGSDGDATRSSRTRDETGRSGPRSSSAPTARKNPVPSRSVAAAPLVAGSDRDPTLVTDRPDGVARPVTAPADVRADAAVQSSPAATGAPARRRGRRVKRVIRRIELWSVLKLSLVLLTCFYAAVLATLVVIWNVAYSSGQIENLQKFLADVGLENYRFYGDRMFKACAAIGAVGVLAGTVLAVITTALINLISEITGGIRLVVIEEDPPPRR